MFLFFAAGFVAGQNGNQPQLRFAVISDTHISRSAHAHEALPKVLKNLLQKKPLPDAVFICGDLTENGWPEEYDALMTTFADRTIVPEGVAIYLMMGNHDHRKKFYVDDTQVLSDCNSNLRFEQMNPDERFTEKTGQPLHQYINIKGYPFITVSMTGGDNLVASKLNPDGSKQYYIDGEFYDEKAIRFLSEKMADAARNYPGKPIFLFSHVGSINTCFGTFPQDDGGQSQFPPFLNGYPQTVFFSGHSHFPVGDPRCIHQENYTSVNAGSASGTSGLHYFMPAPLISQSNSNCMEGLIVNVQKDGTVEIERWDAYRNEEILPRWQLKPPFDGNRFTYANRDGLPAPAFEATATVTGFVNGDDLLVRFPQATDNEVVNHYFIELLDESKTVFYSGNKYSFFYMNSQKPEINVINFPLPGNNGLPPCKTFQIRVTAVDSYGNRSIPIVSKWLTVPASFLREQTF